MNSKYETGVFPITNLDSLSDNYLLYEIVGLHKSDEEYESNLQYIIKSLSFSLKHPITIIHKQDKAYLVVRENKEIVSKIPSEYSVKKGVVIYFKSNGNVIHLDFKNYTSETKPIIIRFLQFDVQTELNKIEGLWQPTSGSGFFDKKSYDSNNFIEVFSGFVPRIIELPEGGFGICIDITKRYVSKKPLPTHLTRQQFRNWNLRQAHLIYKYGIRWYEVKPLEVNDLNVSQSKFIRQEDNKRVSVIEDIHDKFKKGMPAEVAAIPDDATAIMYKTNSGDERSIPAALCYKVYDTEEVEVGKLHKLSIINPFGRRRSIRIVRNRYLKSIAFGNILLEVSKAPLKIDRRILDLPDIEFGNNKIISVKNSPGAIPVAIEQLGRLRTSMLEREDGGFYTTAAFEKQYLVLPETIYNTFGSSEYFLKDLITLVNKMHPTEQGWKPSIITYDDRNKKDSSEIGFEITSKIKAERNKNFQGYAVVMLPAEIVKDKRKHDDLAALVVYECLDMAINASIIHANTLNECYYSSSDNGLSKYHIKGDKRPMYSGYVKGVAINQVLLNNERWPFVLKTPLHADLTIGIDVKKHLAGFTFVDRNCKNILTRLDESGNKEKLTTIQIVKVLVKNITDLSNELNQIFSSIVFHRDGRIFQSEKTGISQAIQILKDRGIVTTNVRVGIVEIPKTSIIPFRLFDVIEEFDPIVFEQDNGKVLNPQIGSVVKLNDNEAFLCTTGREFLRNGTAVPLYIKYEGDKYEFDGVLEDIYFLSSLTYTKPDGCARNPITISMTDRRINTLGSEFNSDALDIIKFTNAEY